jgi:hypothetical protein
MAKLDGKRQAAERLGRVRGMLEFDENVRMSATG